MVKGSRADGERLQRFQIELFGEGSKVRHTEMLAQDDIGETQFLSRGDQGLAVGLRKSSRLEELRKGLARFHEGIEDLIGDRGEFAFRISGENA